MTLRIFRDSFAGVCPFRPDADPLGEVEHRVQTGDREICIYRRMPLLVVQSRNILIVPCVNPDGYYYNQTTNPNGGGLWRKNRRANSDGTFGVDV